VGRRRNIALALTFLALDVIFLRWVIRHFNNWGFWDWDYQQTLLEVSRSSIVDYGQLPLWNPYLGGGVSLAGNTLNHVFSPSFLPVLFLGTIVGAKVCIFIYLAIAQLGVFRLGRARGFGDIESALSAIVFSFGAVYAQKLTHGQFEWIAIAWVPYVLLAVDRFTETPSARHACVGGVFFGLMVLDGGPYQFALFGVFLAIYTLSIAVQRRSAVPLIGFTAITGVAVGITAIKLLPVFELISRYPRETSEDPFYGAPFSPGAFELLHQMFLSRAQVHDPSLWMPYVLNVGSYVGLVPLLLAGLAIVLARQKHMAWIASGAIALWISLGPAAPIDLWHFLHQLPGFSMLRVPSRFNVYVLLAIAMLAGAGLGLLREKLGNPQRATAASLVVAAAIAANLIVVNGEIFKVAFSIPPFATEPPGEFRQHYAYSPFIARYQNTALYPVHPNWPSGSYPAVLENRGVRWAFKTIPFPSHALAFEEAGYAGEARFESGDGRVAALTLTPNRIRVSTEGAGGVLRLNVNHDPGWKIVSGDSSSLAELDGLIGVNVPPGPNTFELAYRPTSFALGTGISVLTLLFVAGALRKGRAQETSP